MGKRFNEELMTKRRWPKLTVGERMRQWREEHGKSLDSKTEAATEGSPVASGGRDSDSPTQDGEKPARGDNRLATRKKRSPKRRKAKGNRAS